MLFFSDCHRVGFGTAGFDLSEIPWTADWRAEKEFFLRVIDTAAGRHGWDRLSYDPPYAASSLAAYRAMVAGFAPVPAAAPDQQAWAAAPRDELLARCGRHDLYQGEEGCRLCDTWIQPVT